MYDLVEINRQAESEEKGTALILPIYVELPTPIATLIFFFHWVMTLLALQISTPLMIPSLV